MSIWLRKICLIGCTVLSFQNHLVAQTNTSQKAQDFNNFAIELYHVIASQTNETFCFSPIRLHSSIKAFQEGTLGSVNHELVNALPTLKHTSDYASRLSTFNKISEATGRDVIKERNLLVMHSAIGLNKVFINQMKQMGYLLPYRTNLFESSKESLKRLGEMLSTQYNGDFLIDITENEVPKFVPSFIVNSQSIDLIWNDTFKSSPKPFKFFGLGSSALDLGYLQSQGTFFFYEDQIVEILELPLSTKKVSVLLFKPKSTLKAFRGSLLGENYHSWTSKLWATRFKTLDIPEIDIESKVSFKTALSEFEIEKMFRASENFKKLTTYEPMYAHDILDYSSVRFGDAHLKTDTLAFRLVQREAKPASKRFRLDQPFFFAIKDNKTELILMIGQYTGL